MSSIFVLVTVFKELAEENDTDDPEEASFGSHEKLEESRSPSNASNKREVMFSLFVGTHNRAAYIEQVNMLKGRKQRTNG